MQPANIAITLRRRTPYEAIDLGLSMLQRWWRAAYAPHLIAGGTLAAAAIGVAWMLGRSWVAILLIWWLKPLYDRVVLHVLSRAVFGEQQSTRAVFADWREWLGSGLFAALVLRLWPDFTRSFNLPVRQLEGQSGREGRERRAVLGRRARGYAVWLTVVCMHFELVLFLLLGGLVDLALPAKATESESLREMLAAGELVGFSGAIGYAATVLLLEPYYVAAGFGLYLNRRTLLEGWDIEVALRRLAERHAAAAGALLLSLFCVFAFPADSYAQNNPKEEIREVLKAKEFGYERDSVRWQPRDPSQPDKKSERAEREGWGGFGYAFAKVVEVLLWVLAGAVLAYALWFLARMLPRGGRQPAPEPYRPPPALFGMDLAPETLPPDVAAAAAALAREGRLREALGLLYRGALSGLVHKRGVRLLASHTEAEVLQLAGGEVHSYMTQLVAAWRQCAYAQRKPAAADIEHLAQGYRASFA